MFRNILLLTLLTTLALGEQVQTQPNFINWLKTGAVEDYNKHVKIINGEPVVQGEVPYQAGLLISVSSGGTGLCGGSLLSSNRVVTAAHCWFDGINTGLQIQVLLGGIRISELENGSVRQNTDEVYTHPSWFPALIRNDIAVVYLPTPVQFTEFIQPISLPTGSELEEDFTGEEALASGWGITSNSATAASPILLAANLRVISQRICSITSPILVTDDNICTSGLGGSSVCNGDSGGPLAIQRDDRTVLIGVTSFRHLTGCESIFPSMFVRVTRYIDWLNGHLIT